jgi:hypothetical protein
VEKAARTFALVLACVTVTPVTAAHAAEPSGATTSVACMKPFFATLDRDANTAVVRVIDLVGPFTGTITAYGADRTWSAAIERAALVELPYGGREASVTVRADGPIEGVSYAPAWAACSFRAGTQPPRSYNAPEVDRPLLTLGNPQPIAPATCAHPYVAPTVKHAVEPNTPDGLDVRGGFAMVAVALDERGVARFARIVDSPGAGVNASVAEAARRSEYSPGTFRCEPAPSSYQFNIGYY